ncbi:MAG: hypothetical protein ACLFR1_09215 [Spirochaetia bacterium]
MLKKRFVFCILLFAMQLSQLHAEEAVFSIVNDVFTWDFMDEWDDHYTYGIAFTYSSSSWSGEVSYESYTLRPEAPEQQGTRIGSVCVETEFTLLEHTLFYWVSARGVSNFSIRSFGNYGGRWLQQNWHTFLGIQRPIPTQLDSGGFAATAGFEPSLIFPSLVPMTASVHYEISLPISHRVSGEVTLLAPHPHLRAELSGGFAAGYFTYTQVPFNQTAQALTGPFIHTYIEMWPIGIDRLFYFFEKWGIGEVRFSLILPESQAINTPGLPVLMTLGKVIDRPGFFTSLTAYPFLTSIAQRLRIGAGALSDSGRIPSMYQYPVNERYFSAGIFCETAYAVNTGVLTLEPYIQIGGQYMQHKYYQVSIAAAVPEALRHNLCFLGTIGFRIGRRWHEHRNTGLDIAFAYIPGIASFGSSSYSPTPYTQRVIISLFSAAGLSSD